MLVASLYSCDDDKNVDNKPDVEVPDPDKDPETPEEEDEVKITISDVAATYNSVTFTVVAEDANAIAYICREAGSEELTAQEVFSMGEPKGVDNGTFTMRNLKSSTDYILCVALQGANGFKGPVTAEFTTEKNEGLPSSPEAAGIRVAQVSESSLIWEVANGSDVDFSLTMVQPSVTIENYCLEAAKDGLSTEEAIKDFMITYGYLCQAVMGGDKVQTVNYSELYSSAVLFPGANYTIFTLGCSGDYAAESSVVPLELSRLEVQTAERPRIGNPDVKVEFVEKGITFLRNRVTPNSDATYWGSLFTKKQELDEFRAYYDRKEGAGAGERRLKEYIQYYDGYITEQTSEYTYSTNVGFDQQGINFSNVAVGFDANLVAGDVYREAVAQVLAPTGEDAVFSISIHDVGAGSFELSYELGGNCMHAYWKLVPAGSLDDTLEDEEAAIALARLLWDEGWALWRQNEPNDNQDVIFTGTETHFGEKQGTTFDVIATGLNYGGALTYPKKVATFTTLERTKGDFDPSLKIEVETVSKTNALLNYITDPNVIKETKERMLYHRLYVAEEIGDYSDESLYSWLMGGDAANANIWTILDPDSSLDSPYSYSWNWAGLEPGTEYMYVWATENIYGEVSNVSTMRFTTLSNDGGDNPEFTITIDPEKITESAGFPTKFTAEAVVKPNADVVSFLHVFVEQYILEEQWFNINDPESLSQGLYSLLLANGIPSINQSSLYNNVLARGGKVWMVAQGQGADGVQSKMSYVCFDEDGNVDDQVDVDITKFIRTSAPKRNVEAPVADINVVEKRTPVHYYGSKISGIKEPKVRIPVPYTDAGEVDGEKLRGYGIPYYSIKEFTLRTMLRGAEPKN